MARQLCPMAGDDVGSRSGPRSTFAGRGARECPAAAPCFRDKRTWHRALSQQAGILESEGEIGRGEGRSVWFRRLGTEGKFLANLLYRLYCKPAPAASGRRAGKKGVSQ